MTSMSFVGIQLT